MVVVAVVVPSFLQQSSFGCCVYGDRIAAAVEPGPGHHRRRRRRRPRLLLPLLRLRHLATFVTIRDPYPGQL